MSRAIPPIPLYAFMACQRQPYFYFPFFNQKPAQSNRPQGLVLNMMLPVHSQVCSANAIKAYLEVKVKLYSFLTSWHWMDVNKQLESPPPKNALTFWRRIFLILAHPVFKM